MKQRIAICLLLLASAEVPAAPPPDRVNFEGVLRNASSGPLTGSFDMVFRLWSAAVGGDEIIVDSHTAAGGSQVAVTGGLFNTELGGGVVTDGAGPGTYATMTDLFRDYSGVYLSIQIGTESLSPRIKVASAGHALNAEHASRLDNLDSAQLLRSDATDAYTSGTLSTAGGTTLDVNGALDLPATGITGAGPGSGLNADRVDGLDSGSFLRSDAIDTATGRVTFAGDPIGPNTSSGSVYVNPTTAVANETLLGIADNGTGVFKVDREGDTEVQGCLAAGNAANVSATIATNSRIVLASTGEAFGVYGRGEDTGDGGIVYGVYGEALAGAPATMKAAVGVRGIAAGGYWSYGVLGAGGEAGGLFEDVNSSGYAEVGYSTYKIWGSGSVSFVQNHPADPDRVIVYNSPEGDEVATYTRGSARLQAGVARVPLGETFALVTNPDVGLTAHVTAREGGSSLHVESITPAELLVRGDRDVAFDYIVYGLRIGFEEVSIVQEKHRDARIPSMADHRQRYEKHPDLRRFNALERWKRMRVVAGDDSPLDLGRSKALREAIVEFDPAVHALEDPLGAPLSMMPGAEAGREPVAHPSPRAVVDVAVAEQAPGSRAAELPADSDGNVYGKSFRTGLADLAQYLPTSGVVEAGDVLVVDRSDPRRVRVSDAPGDAAVVGVAVGEPGLALQGGMAPIAAADPALASRVAEAQARGDRAEASRAWQELVTRFRESNAPVALSGILLCKVDARPGAIRVGDALVTSPTPGHAMRADDPAIGTVIAKALEPLSEGTGKVRVLVMLR